MLFELFPNLWFGPLVATLVWSLIVGASAWLVVYKTPIFNRFLTAKFESAFCTALNLIFVFFMAFMGSDFHANYKNAVDNLVKEKAAVNRLLHTEMPSAAMHQQISLALKDYLNNVINVEWREHFNRQESADATQALTELSAIAAQARRNCIDPQSGACLDQLTATRFYTNVDDLRQAREHRLAIGSLERQTLRYLLCVFLAFNAAVSILAFYRKDPITAIVPLVMYCASVWVAFMIVVLHAEPYVGIRGIKPDALAQVLQGLP